MLPLLEGDLAGADAAPLRRRGGSTYGGEVDDDEGTTTMDDETNRDQGRLRLQKPTFRGSSVGWGIAAVVWLTCVVSVVVRMATASGGPGLVDVMILVALLVATAFCVTGTVATIRHPRPAPPAVDD
ncbi:hypothetical protein ES689_12520 [Frigoribacterium sp. ACAM 257]|uniref:hypothetical protein n=1 Tax=Frigoribacterium sp. ACAM 257 TaxID=2508998 RepID=UPI0011B987B7|nr:hypothetical protein [Frigoribacterium sp. ACAM 257]TWX36223.1 hypothetical protein ES689_12520 [Frigoribacterium sp. ACAM 257]